MSFILSKLLVFFIKPLTWILLFLGGAVFLPLTKQRKFAFVASIVMLLIFSNAWLFNQVAKLSEAPYPTLKQYDVGVLLGGFSNVNSQGKIAFTGAADRILQTIALYKEGVIQKILISSGSANLFKVGPKEADLAAAYLRKLGIPDSAILVENQSRNTQENIRFSFALMESKNVGNQVLIITSAWHIPRTKLIVARDGRYQADFYPTNHLSSADLSWDNYLIPNASTLNDWGVLIKEWMGFLVTKIGIT